MLEEDHQGVQGSLLAFPLPEGQILNQGRQKDPKTIIQDQPEGHRTIGQDPPKAIDQDPRERPPLWTNPSDPFLLYFNQNHLRPS